MSFPFTDTFHRPDETPLDPSKYSTFGGSTVPSLVSHVASAPTASAVLSIGIFTIAQAWTASTVEQLGRTIIDSNGNSQQVIAVVGDQKTGLIAPVWATVLNAFTVDNHVTWICLGNLGTALFPPDQFSEIVLGNFAFNAGCIVRANIGTGNYYSFVAEQGVGFTLCKGLNNNPQNTVLATNTSITSFSAGDMLRLVVIGTTLFARYNSTIIFTLSDSSFAAGAGGFFVTPLSVSSDTTLTLFCAGQTSSTSSPFVDNFHRPNESPLNPINYSRQPTPPIGSGPYTNPLSVVSNACRATVPGFGIAGGGGELYIGAGLMADQFIELIIGAFLNSNSASEIDLICRFDANLDLYTVNITPAGIIALRLINTGPAWTPTTIGTFGAIVLNPGDAIRLGIVNGVLTLTLNWEVIFQITDSAITSGTTGLFIVSPVATSDVEISIYMTGDSSGGGGGGGGGGGSASRIMEFVT